MKPILCLLLHCFCFFTAYSQNSSQRSSSEILQALKKLNTVGSVLYIAAHPDDENTRLLSYLSNEKNCRTGYLSLTRGDGGQNLIGKEQGEMLGLIRTQELLAARRIDGAEQYFTRANDFGFSKNPEETFSIWNKDSILADVVWRIRIFRPDIIICRFPTTGEGGQVHHTASAILAMEAFDAAADPLRFPWQLAHTNVWRAKRIFWNTFNFGSTNTTSEDQLKIDVGGFNPLLGKSYGEIAAESRSMHKSQGFGSAKTRGSSIEYFKFLKGDSAKSDIFENIDLSWDRLTGSKSIQQKLDKCLSTYDAGNPAKSLPLLISAYKELQQLTGVNNQTWKEYKLKEFEKLIFDCAGLWLEASASDYIAIHGKPIQINAQLIKRNDVDLKLNKITWVNGNDSLTRLDAKLNIFYTFKHNDSLQSTTPFSNPYWLNEPHDVGSYKIPDQRLIGTPESKAAAVVVFDIDIMNLNFKVHRDLIYKFADPVKGEIYRKIEVLPPATVNAVEKLYVFNDGIPRKIQFHVRANAESVSGKLLLEAPAGWNVSTTEIPFTTTSKGEEKTLEVLVKPSDAGSGNLKVYLEIAGIKYTKSISRIEYDHIPYQHILNEASVGLVNIKIKKDGLKVGYIPGAGDDVAAALKQVGYDVTILTNELISNEDLSKYNAIISGIRAYNTNDHLQLFYDKLMKYVNDGGNLIVQYNTNNRIGPLVAKIGPYPFTISRDRVTDEKAEVRFVQPTHGALNYPNVITQDDFKGWVQERGIYFATELDKKFETILSMNDPSEKPHEGSLVIAKYGKGNFVYTGLVFFRELPAGVPGAYRLLANLISLPRNK